MAHLSTEDLERWWSAGASDDRARIVEHLAVCDECAVRFGSVMDARPPESSAAADLVDEARLRGYRAYRSAQGARVLSWPRARFVAVGIAAAVLLAVVLTPMLRRPLEAPPDAAVRGSDIQASSPVGSVAAVDEFRWSSPFLASRYRVEVSDRDGRRVGEIESASESVRPDGAVRERLVPGADYSWIVVALDAAGEEISRSRPRHFVVVGSRR